MGEMREFLLAKCQLFDGKGMIKVENNPFAISRITDSGKNHL